MGLFRDGDRFSLTDLLGDEDTWRMNSRWPAARPESRLANDIKIAGSTREIREFTFPAKRRVFTSLIR